MTTDALLADACIRMGRAVESTTAEFGSVHTGTATPALLVRVAVDYYGTRTPLGQLATINRPEARMLTVQPYNQSSMKAVERGIIEAQLGLTPSNDGQIIRLIIPEMTEERRLEMVKLIRSIAEEGRVAIRSIRRLCMCHLRLLKESGETGADDVYRAEAELQRLTDERIAQLDARLGWKEEEILKL